MHQIDKDYIVEIKVRNGPLLRKMREQNYKSVSQFCQAHGLNIDTLKDRALEDIEDFKLRVVRGQKGQILTVLPQIQV